MAVIIRAEQPADRDAIRQVNTEAFGRESEADLVEAVRRSSGFVPELSLVAERDGEIVGHALFSRVTVEGAGNAADVLALAPIAVLPEQQRQGIGGQLIREGLRRSTERGDCAVVVIGHPAYYPRFGFTPARALGLETTFAVPDDVFLALSLRPDGLQGVRGTVIYPLAFREA